MKMISTSQLKARCVAVIDKVAASGESIVVTKNGTPVAEIRPHRLVRAKSLLGLHKGQVTIRGDIVSSCATQLWKLK